jgi:hypothetical protein
VKKAFIEDIVDSMPFFRWSVEFPTLSMTLNGLYLLASSFFDGLSVQMCVSSRSTKFPGLYSIVGRTFLSWNLFMLVDACSNDSFANLNVPCVISTNSFADSFQTVFSYSPLIFDC